MTLGLVLAFFFAGCVYLPKPALPDPSRLTPELRAAQNQRVYDSAWDLVRRGYFSSKFNEVDWAAARERHLPAAVAAPTDAELYGVINALIDELQDDHTHAMSSREADDTDSEQRVLLGLLMRPASADEKTGPMMIVETIPGSNAMESGVEPGWVLVSCDDAAPLNVLGLGRIRENQVVQCVFRDRLDQERNVPLTARRLSMAPIQEARSLEDGVVLLRFDKFDSESARWLRDQLKQHARAPGIVLDLRQNPGGDAAALGRMLGEFFTGPVEMGTFITRRGINDHLRAWRWLWSARYTGPLVVLVSRTSASSSEIFSAVMQYHRRATIVGEKTAGAVLASRFFPLPGGGRLQLSIDDYLAPDGRRLERNGVTPDVIVQPTLADLRAGRDPVLAAALEELRRTTSTPRK